jgi:hypothetical protein
MDEREWLTCADPERMLVNLRGKGSDRKLQLFGVGCCRRIWHLLIDDRSKNAVLTVERDADMMSSPEEVAVAFSDSEIAFRACEHITDRHADAAGAAHDLTASCEDMILKAGSMALATANAAGYLEDDSFFAYREDVEVEYPHQCSLIRDIFGNPFRPVALSPALRTPAVLALAQAAYENRTLPSGHLEHDRLAILADALEEAGCTDQDILTHLRAPGPHVRGCWVVDLLLGKT